MKKRFLVLVLLVLCATALPIVASAASSGDCGGRVTWTLDDNGLLTISGTGEMLYSSSWEKDAVRKVKIQEGVTAVCDYAFYNFSNLTSVTLPSSLTTLGTDTFFGCSSLKSIVIPSGVSNIGRWTFGNCPCLTSITIPSSVTSIGYAAFYGCDKLASVTLPNNIATFESYAFSSDTLLYAKINSKTAKALSKAGFSFREPGTKLDLMYQYTGDTLKGLALVGGDKRLTSITVPDGVAIIEANAFYNPFTDDFKNLTTAIIPNSVKEIGESAFSVSTKFIVEKDSYAHKYALDHGIPFVLQGEEEKTGSTASTVSEKVKQIVNEVVRSGMSDYQKAIALHNYLTAHANYDYTFSNYHADGVLLKKTGVCQSYTEAYALLLDAVGIQNWKEHGSNHTWNVAKLDGSWCHIDVTWDDPGEGGFEYHDYFAITDFALEGVSSHERFDRETACTNYKISYAYRNGVLQSIVSEWKAQMNDKIAAGNYSFSITGELKGSSGINTRMAYQMLQDESSSTDGKEEKPKLSYKDNIADSNYTIGVKFSPSVKNQPQNVSVNAGETATFKVNASRATSYQWYYRKTSSDTWSIVKNNGTSASYKLTTAASHNGYQFRCLVKNNAGSVYSSIATLTVTNKPVITVQPSSLTVKTGDTATFKVTATGNPAYQWYYRKPNSDVWNKVMNNGTAAAYSLVAAASHNGYQFRCLLKNDEGSVNTNTVTLTVNSKPIITIQPSNVSVSPGSTATFKVTATGAKSYQWYYRKTSSATWNIVRNDGTSATYKLTTAASHNSYQFRCLVKNSVGSVYTNIVTLTVGNKPVITGQPGNAHVSAGSVATFKVTASRATSYQWYYRTSSSGTWNIVKNNGTSSTYKLTVAATHHGYQFRCLVKNSAGSVYSSIATLTIPPVFTTQPTNAKVKIGETATFKAVASRATSYQWYYRTSSSGTWNIVKNNGTSSTYNLTVAATHHGYQFRCLAKNSAGSVYSSIATLAIPPVITTQPVSAKVSIGSTATYKVVASRATSYQWYYRTSSTGTWNIVKNNGTSATYNLTVASNHYGYQFRCLVKNSAGSVYSNTVSLTKPATKPVFTTQPTSTTVSAGTTATFKAVASNATSYQWYYRTSSSGAWNIVKNNGTSTTYKLTTTASHNGYQFRCLAKNSVGSVYSNIATLTVKASIPTITTQPASAKVNEGATATFKVVASNATSYQWYYRTSSSAAWNIVKNNGTSATYKLTVAANHNGYQFRCLVKNSAGSIYTNIATLTLNTIPVITTQPSSAKVTAGATATFKVVATGATGYQWYYRTSSSGAWNIVKNNGTSATYNLTTAASHNGYQFRCLVKNSAGSVYTMVATLTLNTIPTITSQPASAKVNIGATATFKVAATGATSYQWYYRTSSSGTWNIVKNNGTSATYKLTTTASHNGYQFRCLVKNSAGSVYSNIATLTVIVSEPIITAHPTSQSVTAGQAVTFKVTATGATSYQWEYRKANTTSWITVKINGTSAAYTLTTAASNDGDQFRCLVKNASGSVYSNIAKLEVK